MKNIQEIAKIAFQKPNSENVLPFDAKYFCEFATAWMRKSSPNKTQEFVLDKHNEQVVRMLWDYFFNPSKFDNDYPNYSSAKGILLFGPPGSGKTELLWILNGLCQKHKQFSCKSRGKIKYGFGSTSFWNLLKMYEEEKNPPIDNDAHWFYDELGLDSCRLFKTYGRAIDIDTRVLQLRYKVFRSGVITHFTTNLDLAMMEDPHTGYDQRTLSRIKEMCNIIPFIGIDRRAMVKTQRKEWIDEDSNLNLEDIQSNRKFFLQEIQHAKETKEYPVLEARIAIWYDIAIEEKLFEISVQKRWDELLQARQEIYQRYNNGKSQILLKHKRMEWQVFQEHLSLGKLIKENVFENESINRAKANSIKKYYLEA